jgi:hypothetical protein
MIVPRKWLVGLDVNHRPGGPGWPLHRYQIYFSRPTNTVGQTFFDRRTLALFARPFNRQAGESALLCANEHKLSAGDT